MVILGGLGVSYERGTPAVVPGEGSGDLGVHNAHGRCLVTGSRTTHLPHQTPTPPIAGERKRGGYLCKHVVKRIDLHV